MSVPNKAALTRTTDVNDLTPVITLQVDNNGKGTAFLSAYSLSRKGNAKTSANVTDYISVVSSTGKGLTSVATGDYLSGFISLASVVKDAKTLLSITSSEYNTGESIALTHKEQYVVSTCLDSPIRLSGVGDWVQFRLNLGGRRSEDTGTKEKQLSTFTVNFAFR